MVSPRMPGTLDPSQSAASPPPGPGFAITAAPSTKSPSAKRSSAAPSCTPGAGSFRHHAHTIQSHDEVAGLGNPRSGRHRCVGRTLPARSPGQAAGRLRGGWFAEWFAFLAVPGVLAVFLLTATIFIGLASRFTEEQDREWWGAPVPGS